MARAVQQKCPGDSFASSGRSGRNAQLVSAGVPLTARGLPCNKMKG